MVHFKGCFEENIDYFGNDISHLNSILSEEQCQFKCQELDNCKFLRYSESPQTCHLKTKKENVNELSGGSSGPRFCNGNKRNKSLSKIDNHLKISILKGM